MSARDKKRLDWMEKNGVLVHFPLGGSRIGITVYGKHSEYSVSASSLREAIDKAMKFNGEK